MLTRYISDNFFDSLLDTSHVSSTTNANLYLIIRVFLNKINPRGGAASGTINFSVFNPNQTIRRWNGGEWNNFKRDFKRSCEDVWNNRLWLIARHPWIYRHGMTSPTIQPNVRCMIRLDLQNSNSNAHVKFDCVKVLNTDNLPRPSLDRGAHQGWLSNRDVNPLFMANSASGPINQVRAAHEVGHQIGLSHVGGRGNGPNPYRCSRSTGNCGSHSQSDIMGAGGRVEEWHALPWKEIIMMHTGYGRHPYPQEYRDVRRHFWVSLNRQPPHRIPSYLIERRPGFQDFDGGVPPSAGVPMPGSVGGE